MTATGMGFSVPAGNALVFSTSAGDVLDVPDVSPITRWVTEPAKADQLVPARAV